VPSTGLAPRCVRDAGPWPTGSTGSLADPRLPIPGEAAHRSEMMPPTDSKMMSTHHSGMTSPGGGCLLLADSGPFLWLSEGGTRCQQRERPCAKRKWRPPPEDQFAGVEITVQVVGDLIRHR
jgi:hypothetical protein